MDINKLVDSVCQELDIEVESGNGEIFLKTESGYIELMAHDLYEFFNPSGDILPYQNLDNIICSINYPINERDRKRLLFAS